MNVSNSSSNYKLKSDLITSIWPNRLVGFVGWNVWCFWDKTWSGHQCWRWLLVGDRMDKYILKCWKIQFAIWTDTFCHIFATCCRRYHVGKWSKEWMTDKSCQFEQLHYIMKFVQIQFAIWANSFCHIFATWWLVGQRVGDRLKLAIWTNTFCN